MDLYSMLAPAPETAKVYGVVVAVVTNNRDPDNLARVKVTFPWLSDKAESDWVRIASPLAGGNRGLLMIPEVDDEVLVAFEHGMIERPYILGALWNGKDKPPKPADKPAQVRSLTTASGHVIRLDDANGAEKIEITAAKGKSTIVLDTQAGTITVKTDKDLIIESANGAVKITGKSVEITASGAIKLDAKQDLELKAGVSLKQSGSTAELKGSANLVLKGGVVNIN